MVDASQLDQLLSDNTRTLVSAALIAYNAMETTKRRHFDYLNKLESKRKKFNLEATSAEQALRASLLADHDQTVKNFKAEAQRLQSVSPEAHLSLFKYIGLLNELADDATASQSASH